MIISMSELLIFTNRALCQEPFEERIRHLAQMRPAGIVLREKDLPEAKYKILARRIMEICSAYDTPCILHSYTSVAAELNCDAIHLPLHLLRALTAKERSSFQILGASCHSVSEAQEAERLGCTYLTAGHIFATDCKKGLPGRGLGFLEEVCSHVSIPVYAIGGIHASNCSMVRRAGAFGICVMSGAMVCENIPEYLAGLEVHHETKP